MSWDADAMSVLPESTQHSIQENFTPEFLAEELSDYVVELQEVIKKVKEIANDAPEINLNNFESSQIEELNEAMMDVYTEGENI